MRGHFSWAADANAPAAALSKEQQEQEQESGLLPAPFFVASKPSLPGSDDDPAVVFLGSSLLCAPPLVLSTRVGGADQTTPSPSPNRRGECEWEFELEWMPLKEGVVPLGGIRALSLVGDRVMAVLGEWEIVGEVWVGAHV